MSTEISPELLVDKICIQWMQERREGRAVSLSDYVERFPLLRQPNHLLDLIDADLCVTQERGETVDLKLYTEQFPELADQIQLLIDLESFDQNRVNVALPAEDLQDSNLSRSNISLFGSISTSSSQYPADSNQLLGLPVALPANFLAIEVVLASASHWLVRGRHAQSGLPIGLKVVSLDKSLKSARLSDVLDVCEAASNVKHSAWIAPQMAFIENNHLGVVRPWVFAAPRSQIGDVSQQKAFEQICTIAMALQSAHDSGATHGFVCESNIITDHAGNSFLLDAASSHQGWNRTWKGSDTVETGVASFSFRRAEDIRSLLHWIATVWIDLDWLESSPTLNQLQMAVRGHDSQGCAAIADLVYQSLHQRPLASPAPSRRWWKRTGTSS